MTLKVVEGDYQKKSKAVLVVGDDIEAVRLVAEALKMDGVTIYKELSGTGAIATIQELRPRVLIIDINMPRIDGIQVAEMAVSANPAAKIILMSGDFDAVARANRARVAVHAVVDKPVPVRQLRRFVREALGLPREN